MTALLRRKMSAGALRHGGWTTPCVFAGSARCAGAKKGTLSSKTTTAGTDHAADFRRHVSSAPALKPHAALAAIA